MQHARVFRFLHVWIFGELCDQSRSCLRTVRSRARPENIVTGSSSLSIAGPTPRTRPNSCSEPKAPNESRFATIRFASAGPTRGSLSSSSAVATSTSIMSGNGNCCVPAASRAEPPDSPFAFTADFFETRFRDDRLFRAESTACSCASTVSAPDATAAWASSRTSLFRHTCTLPPSSATPARKASACRSAAVGIGLRNSDAGILISSVSTATSNHCGLSRNISSTSHFTCTEMQLQYGAEYCHRCLPVVVAIKDHRMRTGKTERRDF